MKLSIDNSILSICLSCLILIGSTPSVLAAPLEERLAQFPQWKSKSPVQTAKGDLIYPEWMAGTWNVTSTLIQQVAPLAPDIMTPGFEDNESYLNRPVKFKVRFGKEYFSPQKKWFFSKSDRLSGVVADRAFNGEKIAQAYLGDDNVYRVKVDPKNPNQQITLLKGERKLISRIRGRARETPQPERFITSEVTQQLFRSPDRIYLNEVETTSAYELINSGQISAEQITAIYLSPQDPDYFAAGDRPVALYRYHLDLVREE